MFIRTFYKNHLIDMSHFDGIGLTDAGSGKFSLTLFKAKPVEDCRRSIKCDMPFAAYGKEQALKIMEEIEQAAINGEKLYVLPEPEAENA